MKDIITVADFNKTAISKMRKLNSGQVIYACACGCSRFELLQDTDNIKAACVSCNDLRIIAWNSKGSILRLDTLVWQNPVVSIEMK